MTVFGAGAFRAAAAALLLALATLLTAGCSSQQTIDTEELGPIPLFIPDGRPSGLVFLISDANGWSRKMARLAQHFRSRGQIVAGIDARQLLAHLTPDEAQCFSLTPVFERISQRIQGGASLDFYHLPVLAGVGDGATLALAGLWQAGPETIAGALTVNFRPSLASRLPLCAEPPAQPAGDGRGFAYTAPQALFGWWQGAWTEPVTAETQLYFPLMGAAQPAAIERSSPSVALRRLFDQNSEEQERDAAQALKLGDLPVVDLPGRPGTDIAAIVLSGDGGWRDLDRELGQILATAGVRVIGIDTLRYFWSEKSPEETAMEFDRLIADLGERTGIRKIALIGYSFGADVLPALYNRLDAQTRERIVLISLLALGRDAHFEIHVSGWLGGDEAEDAMPIAPELAAINPRLLQCIYGTEESSDTGCRDLASPPAEVIAIAGGHHFDEDYPALAERILHRLHAARIGQK